MWSVGLQSVFVACTSVSFIHHVLWFKGLLEGKVRFKCREMVKIHFLHSNVVPGSMIYVDTSNPAKSGRYSASSHFKPDLFSVEHRRRYFEECLHVWFLIGLQCVFVPSFLQNIFYTRQKTRRFKYTWIRFVWVNYTYNFCYRCGDL